MRNLRNAIGQISSNVDSVRDFVEVYTEHLEEHIEMIEEEHAEDVEPVFQAMSETMDSDDDEVPQVPDEYSDIIEVREDTVEEDAEYEVFVREGYREGYREAMEEIDDLKDRAELLYNGALMNLTSQIEHFFSDIMHAYYEEYPSALGSGNEVFSLEDLENFDSIGDAKKEYISNKVENVLHGSFEDWVEHMKRNMNMSMSYLDGRRGELVELFERRNLIVHARGVVNRTYLQNVDERYRKDVQKGDVIKVKEEYLSNKYGVVEGTCILVALEMWKNMDNCDKERSDLIAGPLTHNSLLGKNFEVLRDISKFLVKDKRMPEGDRTLAKLNYWLAKKRLGNWSDVKENVEEADFSAKGNMYRLGYASLTEDKETFFDLLPSVVETNDHLSIEVIEWFPIFEEMRQTEEWGKHIKNIEE